MTDEQIEVMNIITFNPLKRRIHLKDVFNKYDKLYPFTTESLKYYMGNLTGQDVLCVAASGDHAIEAFYHGAKSVDTFDINVLAKYYQDLKFNALKTLSYEEFFTLFTKKGNTYKKNEAYNIYLKVREYLTKETQDIFDYVLLNYALNNNLLGNNLFYEPDDFRMLNNRVSYINKTDYYRTQDILQDKEVTFINSSLSRLINRLDTNYDTMFLSNITSYSYNIDRDIRILSTLMDYLKEYGEMYFAYIYRDDSFQLNPSYTELDVVYENCVPNIRNIKEKDRVYYTKRT